MYLHILHMHIVEFKSMAYDTNIEKNTYVYKMMYVKVTITNIHSSHKRFRL